MFYINISEYKNIGRFYYFVIHCVISRLQILNALSSYFSGFQQFALFLSKYPKVIKKLWKLCFSYLYTARSSLIVYKRQAYMHANH